MAQAVSELFPGLSLYEILGVDATASAEKLKRGYLKKALLWVRERDTLLCTQARHFPENLNSLRGNATRIA